MENVHQMEQFWYRFEDVRRAPSADECGEATGPGSTTVLFMKIKVIKHTPKGVRLMDGTFVRRDTRKRYACPTIEEAKESFRARKAAQKSYLQAKIDHVNEALRILNRNADRIMIGSDDSFSVRTLYNYG